MRITTLPRTVDSSEPWLLNYLALARFLWVVCFTAPADLRSTLPCAPFLTGDSAPTVAASGVHLRTTSRYSALGAAVCHGQCVPPLVRA